MPIRIPFTRRHEVAVNGGDSLRPGSSAAADPAAAGTPQGQSPHPTTPSFERVDTVGSIASSARSRKSQDTGEYKMSVVNDSGVYLPPSPTERDSSWASRRYLPRPSTDSHRSGHNAAAVPPTGEIEPFSISRESFDSYRRSFDISARSPVLANTDFGPARMSLDSAARPGQFGAKKYRPRANLREVPAQFKWEPPSTEEAFEDVGLNDETAAANAAAATNSHRFLSGLGSSNNSSSNTPGYFNRKRTGFLSKFGGDHDATTPTEGTVAAANSTNNTNSTTAGTPASHGTAGNAGVSRFLMSTRKRASSGQGAELAPMDRPSTAKSSEAQEAQS